MDLNPPPPIFLRRFKECLQQVSVTLFGFKLHSSYLGRRESIEIAPEVTLCDRYWAIIAVPMSLPFEMECPSTYSII